MKYNIPYFNVAVIQNGDGKDSFANQFALRLRLPTASGWMYYQVPVPSGTTLHRTTGRSLGFMRRCPVMSTEACIAIVI